MKAQTIFDLGIGESIDWKFGMISRDVYRVSEKKFEINDTSSGWVSAYVSKKVMGELVEGKKSLLELDWK